MVKPEISNGLPPDEIIRRIEKALKHGGGTHTWDDVRQGLIDGQFQIHWNEGGVAITEIQVFPQRKQLHCFVVAGELESVVALREDMARFARANGCSVITASGRIGWERVLPKTGWRKTHSIFTFDPWKE